MNHTGTVNIQTDRLFLRRFVMDDAEDIYKNYGSDPEVNRYIAFAPCQTLENTKAFIQMHLDQYDLRPSFYGWGIAKDNKIIGSIGVFHIDNDLRSGELGYSLGSKFWGQGLTTEAARAVLNHMFQVVGFHKIFSSYHEENTASGLVMQKIGMTYEGISRDGQKERDGKYKNLIYYSILETDYNTKMRKNDESERTNVKKSPV